MLNIVLLCALVLAAQIVIDAEQLLGLSGTSCIPSVKEAGQILALEVLSDLEQLAVNFSLIKQFLYLGSLCNMILITGKFKNSVT